MRVPEAIQLYLEKHLKRCLSKEERDALYKENPRPDLDISMPPKADKFITDFLGKKFPKENDGDLIKIQTAVLACIRPLVSAWHELQDKLDESEDGKVLVPADEVISMVQRVVCMVGNASEYISQTRRSKILGSIDPTWSKFAVDSSKSPDCLFGQDFQSSLMGLVEKEVSISKAVYITNRNKRASDSSLSSSKGPKRPYKPFFRGSPAAKYGGRQGRNQPYQTSSNRQTSNVSQYHYQRNNRGKRPAAYNSQRYHEPKLPEPSTQSHKSQ